jgi:hypothetical protein
VRWLQDSYTYVYIYIHRAKEGKMHEHRANIYIKTPMHACAHLASKSGHSKVVTRLKYMHTYIERKWAKWVGTRLIYIRIRIHT